MNYCDTLFAIPARCDDRTVFSDIEKGYSVTYNKLKTLVQQYAIFYIENGVNPGDVVALHIFNSIEFICAHMGAQYIGAASCLLDPLAQARSLPYHLKQTKCRLFITHLENEEITTDISDLCATFNIDTVVQRISVNNKPELLPEMFDWDPVKTSYIYYTSGTTSLPKGVPLNYKNHQNFFKIACKYWKPSDSDSRHICFVPFSHGFGSVFLIPWTILTQSEMFILRSFHPLKVEETVRIHNITHIYGVPSHYQQLLRLKQAHSTLKNLQMAFCAASKLDQAIMEEWKRVTGKPLHEGYGLIETTGGVVWRVHQESLRTGHVGTCPSEELIEVGIVDEHDNAVNPGVEGEIVIRGNSVTTGYLDMPDENKVIFRNNWFHTGDKGYITSDRQLVMTGRIKDIINIAGIKISPFEVESVLNSHTAVQMSAVVAAEDRVFGEIVKAFVMLKDNCSLTERELVKYCTLHLINFQVPKQIIFVKDFPKNTMGKIDRKQLRTM
ncbi:MAG TPA: class I adenylate-forming enzyme family protein [Chitinispirillaceae bacterium]|nr:class I adenylate-forming enzyme family protein [Chitinispirillaceae bacterium]